MRKIRFLAVLPLLVASLVSIAHPGAARATYSPRWDIESDMTYCLIGGCTYTSGAPAYEVVANVTGAYGISSSLFTPASISLGCEHYWTDSAGVRHFEYGVINASGTHVSGFMQTQLFSTATEANTNFEVTWGASIKATDVYGNQARAVGTQYYNNDTDSINAGTLSVHYSGSVYREHYNGTNWVFDGYGFNSIFCVSQPAVVLVPGTSVTGEGEFE
jgi:hypothetical protein